MDVFNQEELKTLLADETRACVSLTMPTHRAGEIRESVTRLKNLMRGAQKQLLELGMDAPEADMLLAPVQQLLGDTDFWQYQGEGLAIFRSPELFRLYRVGLALEEQAVVADHFHIQPLLPLLNSNGRFFLLAISQNDIRLFRGNRGQIRQIKLEGVPLNMAAALNEEPERHHYDRQNAFGAGMPFHGHSEAKDDNKEKITRFFHRVDKGLHKYLRNETVPLLLAGVEYEISLYREANTYPNLHAEAIFGNPQILEASALRERAWPLVEPIYAQARKDAIDRYRESRGNTPTLVSEDLAEIVSGAAFGRVDTLFTCLGEQRPGLFHADTHAVELHAEMEPGDEDLINFAAMQTLRHSGFVYALPREEMPTDAPVAAIFRYEMPNTAALETASAGSR